MRRALCVSRLFMMSPAQDDSSCIWNVLTLETGKKRTDVSFVCVKCFKPVSAVDTKCKTQRQDWETNSARVNSFGGGIQVTIFRVLIRVSVCATYIQYIKHADHTVSAAFVLWIYILNSQWNEPRCTINKKNDTIGDVSRGLWVLKKVKPGASSKKNCCAKASTTCGISRIQNSETVAFSDVGDHSFICFASLLTLTNGHRKAELWGETGGR